MDDFNVPVLHQSKNEWTAKLLDILTTEILLGVNSIFEEAVRMCQIEGQADKYLVTFQNFLSRVPKWNQHVVNLEKERILQHSNCPYLEDLVTCTHIVQLKLLSAMRITSKQKKIDIPIPNLSDFIHKVYIHTARKLYTNVYLFVQEQPPLKRLENKAEIQKCIEWAILRGIRESLPVEAVLQAYMEETIETHDREEVIDPEIIAAEAVAAAAATAAATAESKPAQDAESKPATESIDGLTPIEVSLDEITATSAEAVKEDKPLEVVKETVKDDIKPIQLEEKNEGGSSGSLRFNDKDLVSDVNNVISVVDAPKTIDRLEEISELRYAQRKKDEEAEDDDEKLKISGPNETFVLDDIQELS